MAEVSEKEKQAATQRLYLLLPNHKCPNKKGCPFHPPDEEEEELEEAEVTMPVNRRLSYVPPVEDKAMTEKLIAERLAKITGRKLSLETIPAAPEEPLKESPSLTSVVSGYESATLDVVESSSESEEEVMPLIEEEQQVEVLEKPAFTSQVDPLRKNEGELASFSCSCTGSPNPALKWLV